jgi:hypothetical protein
MDWRTSYFDLCKEIEILELRAADLEFQMNIARKVCFRGYISDQYSRIPLDKALNTYDNIKDELLGTVTILEHKIKTKLQMEKHIDQFEGLEYKVAYMRDIQDKPLDIIADELGYSYDWIRRISGRIKRLQRIS